MQDDDLEPDAGRIRLEQLLETENAKCDQLKQALSEFKHMNRRIADRLERVGGRSADLEQQRSLLAENLKITERELPKTEAHISKIRRELAKLAAD